MGKKVGIDLGTTYSVVSYVDETGTIVNIESSEGEKTTPSVVFFDPDGQTVVVGSSAREAGAMNPECLVERVKSYMDDATKQIPMNGESYSPSAVSSIILTKLIRDAETALGGEEIEGAVITCPAYFGDVAKNATKMAGENVILANGEHLKVLRIIDEPTAAAIAYGNSRNEDMHKTVLIYDLGGGTFDCTVMKLDFEGMKKDYQVITTGGNHMLGGKDWDQRLSEYVIAEFCNATGCDAKDMAEDFEIKAWLSENVEKAKKLLTNKPSTTLTPSFDGQKYKVEITREKFDELTEGLFNETVSLIDKMMAASSLNFENNIDEIILIGGSTRMPQVTEKLAQIYNKPITTYDPDKAVSNGAALVASGMNVNPQPQPDDSQNPQQPGGGGSLSNNQTSFKGKNGEEGVVHEVCNKSYCFRYFSSGEEKYGNLIFKDEPKPAVGTTASLGMGAFVLSTANPPYMMDSIMLKVMENEVKNKDKDDKTVDIGQCSQIFDEVEMKLEPPLSSDTPIIVELALDPSGIISMTLVEENTGVRHTIKLQRKDQDLMESGMTAANKLSLG